MDNKLSKVREEIKGLQRAHKTQIDRRIYKELQEAKLKLDSLSINFVINSTLKVWYNIKETLHQEIGLPRHILIWNNPSITIQNSQLYWGTWIKLGIQRLSDIISVNSVLPFCELKSKYTLIDTEFFRYVQLKNWVTVSTILI